MSITRGAWIDDDEMDAFWALANARYPQGSNPALGSVRGTPPAAAWLTDLNTLRASLLPDAQSLLYDKLAYCNSGPWGIGRGFSIVAPYSSLCKDVSFMFPYPGTGTLTVAGVAAFGAQVCMIPCFSGGTDEFAGGYCNLVWSVTIIIGGNQSAVLNANFSGPGWTEYGSGWGYYQMSSTLPGYTSNSDGSISFNDVTVSPGTYTITATPVQVNGYLPALYAGLQTFSCGGGIGNLYNALHDTAYPGTPTLSAVNSSMHEIAGISASFPVMQVDASLTDFTGIGATGYPFGIWDPQDTFANRNVYSYQAIFSNDWVGIKTGMWRGLTVPMCGTRDVTGYMPVATQGIAPQAVTGLIPVDRREIFVCVQPAVGTYPVSNGVNGKNRIPPYPVVPAGTTPVLSSANWSSWWSLSIGPFSYAFPTMGIVLQDLVLRRQPIKDGNGIYYAPDWDQAATVILGCMHGSTFYPFPISPFVIPAESQELRVNNIFIPVFDGIPLCYTATLAPPPGGTGSYPIQVNVWATPYETCSSFSDGPSNGAFYPILAAHVADLNDLLTKLE